jgi:2-polyprenyl-3-methyl-5-hydroxy-6-metoxy-1,4-benzoquinol methylase
MLEKIKSIAKKHLIIRKTYYLAMASHCLLRHWIASITGRYYFEDNIRVCPDHKDNNFLNHCKFYKFAAQFVNNKRVADIGCGTGYGCEILKQKGAASVRGSDISKKAIKYASSKYGDIADFIIQNVTDLKEYSDNSFDVSVCSEVLEHVKEYCKEQDAIAEIKRITNNKGLLIIGTPNSELLGQHGFSYKEIKSLFQKNFSRFCIFENALMPSGSKKFLWEERVTNGEVGIIISENIDLSETCLLDSSQPQIKNGLKAGIFTFVNYDIDTTLLHNTHSWVIIAINDK